MDRVRARPGPGPEGFPGTQSACWVFSRGPSCYPDSSRPLGWDHNNVWDMVLVRGPY